MDFSINASLIEFFAAVLLFLFSGTFIFFFFVFIYFQRAFFIFWTIIMDFLNFCWHFFITKIFFFSLNLLLIKKWISSPPPPWFNMFIYLRMLITVFWCFFLFPQSSYFCLFCSLSFILVTFCKRLKILRSYLLLLLLSRLSRVWLCATPQMAAHQALPSLGFSRQEHWSGLPFPSPMHESENWKWSRSVMSDSLWPHGLQPTRLLCPWVFQARVLEWGAIAFSDLGNKFFERVPHKLGNLQEHATKRHPKLIRSSVWWATIWGH